MKIGDRVYVHGYVDEIRKDTVIIRNNGGYFGTIPSEIIKGDLVRCKNCIHSTVLLDEYDNECGYVCKITYDSGGFRLEVEKDHFCGYGE